MRTVQCWCRQICGAALIVDLGADVSNFITSVNNIFSFMLPYGLVRWPEQQQKWNHFRSTMVNAKSSLLECRPEESILSWAGILEILKIPAKLKLHLYEWVMWRPLPGGRESGRTRNYGWHFTDLFKIILGHIKKKSGTRKETTEDRSEEGKGRREEKLMVNYSNGTDPFLEVEIEVRDHRET